MKDFRLAVVGTGATGSVLAAALRKRDPETILVDPAPGMGETLQKGVSTPYYVTMTNGSSL